MGSLVQAIRQRIHGKPNEHQPLVVRRLAGRRYSMMEASNSAGPESGFRNALPAIDLNMMMAVWEHGAKSEEKLSGLKIEHYRLKFENAQLRSEMAQLQDMFALKWPMHILRIQTRIETIYTKFKVLDDLVRADDAAADGPLRLERLKKSWVRSNEKTEREKDGISSACHNYFNSMGKFFSEIEQFYQDLPNLPDRINKEWENVKEQKSSVKIDSAASPNSLNQITPIASVSEPEKGHVLASPSSEMVAVFEAAESKLMEKAEPIQQAILAAQLENNQLQQEKTVLKSTHEQQFASCHSYLKQHLTVPLKRRPIPNNYYWENLSRYRYPDQKLLKDDAHCYTKMAEKIEKMFTKWEEIASLIETLLNE